VAGKGARGLLRTGVNRPDWTPAQFQTGRDQALQGLKDLLATGPSRDKWNDSVSYHWGHWAITDTEADALAENPDFISELATRSPWVSSRGRVQDPCGDIATPRESQACRDDEAAGGGAAKAEAEASKYVRQPSPTGAPAGGGGAPGAGGAPAGGGGLAAMLPALLGALGGRGASGLGPLGAALGGAGGAPAAAPGGGSLEASTAGAFLAQQLQRMAEQRDPAAQAGLAELGRRATLEPVQRGQERAARDTVATVRETVLPELVAARQAAEHEALQVQASAESRERTAEDAWRRQALALLDRASTRSVPRRY